jgi:hypothetical protein
LRVFNMVFDPLESDWTDSPLLSLRDGHGVPCPHDGQNVRLKFPAFAAVGLD